MPYFGGALMLMIAARRRWLDLPAALITLGLWAVFIARGLPAIFGFAASNGNTQIYGTIVDAWLHFWRPLPGWGGLLLGVPRVFVSNFFFGNMVFLPLLLCGLVVMHLRWGIRPVF